MHNILVVAAAHNHHLAAPPPQRRWNWGSAHGGSPDQGRDQKWVPGRAAHPQRQTWGGSCHAVLSSTPHPDRQINTTSWHVNQHHILREKSTSHPDMQINIRHSATLPSKANSRHFSSQNISGKRHCPSPLSVYTVCVCVCVCVWVCVRARACVCVHLLHSCAWTLVDVYIMCQLFVKLLITFSILMYIMCVILCLFIALSRRVGTL